MLCPKCENKVRFGGGTSDLLALSWICDNCVSSIVIGEPEIKGYISEIKILNGIIDDLNKEIDEIIDDLPQL